MFKSKFICSYVISSAVCVIHMFSSSYVISLDGSNELSLGVSVVYMFRRFYVVSLGVCVAHIFRSF